MPSLTPAIKLFSALSLDEIADQLEASPAEAQTPNRRRFTGTIVSGDLTRNGDKVLPSGATFKLPIPLLWQHDADAPIGQVDALELTNDGLKANFSIPVDVASPPALSARILEALTSIDKGLVTGLSVGIQPLDWYFEKDGDTPVITQYDLLELSLVTIPADKSARVDMDEFQTYAVKLKDQNRMQLNKLAEDAEREATARMYAHTAESKPQPRALVCESQDTAQLEYAQAVARALDADLIKYKAELEELKKLEAELSARVKEQQAHVDARAFLQFASASIDDDWAKLKQEQKKFDVKVAEITEDLKKQTEDLKKQQQTQKDTETMAIETKLNTYKGKALAQFLTLKASMADRSKSPRDYAKHLGIPEQIVSYALASNSELAPNDPFLHELKNELTELVAEVSVFDKIKGKREIMFDSAPVAFKEISAGFTARARLKPVEMQEFDRFDPLRRTKVAVIVPYALEDIMRGGEKFERLLLQSAVNALARAVDEQFFSARLADASSPAGIFNYCLPVDFTNGTTALNLNGLPYRLMQTLLPHLAQNSANPTFVGDAFTIAGLASEQLDIVNIPRYQTLTPDATLNGTASLFGFGVYTTNVANFLSLIDGASIAYASGEFLASVSDQATLTLADGEHLNLFQANLQALRVERFINWTSLKRIAGSVALNATRPAVFDKDAIQKQINGFADKVRKLETKAEVKAEAQATN